MNSIFVSSTFRDMHFERDVLNRIVSAKLNRYLSAYNQSVRILDLRWGVDTSELSEEEATERVLRTCFDAIDDCKPYMIILLGDRYGYIPEENDLSVTHMEILRGALQSTDPEHVFIYLRRADYSGLPDELQKLYKESSPKARTQLEELKAELLRTLPDRCRWYNARWAPDKQLLVSDAFEALVYEDLEKDLTESLSLRHYRSELEKQLVENDEILADNLRYAYCDQRQLQNRLKGILSAEMPYGIIGQGGSGKSVYVSLVCSGLREMGYRANVLFCGDNAFSASVRNAAEMVLYCLTVSSGEAYPFEENAQLSYNELLDALIRKRESAAGKSYIILDAVDKCEEGMVNFLLWCHRFLSEHIALVFSAQETAEIQEAEKSFALSTMAYDAQNLQDMAQRLLGKHGKSIKHSLVDQICQKVSTPLQLHVLLLRLLNLNSQDFSAIEKMGNGMDAINAYLEKLIREASADEDQLIADYISALLQASENPDFALLLLSFIGFSDRGLRETDLQNLMGFTVVDWVQMDYMDFLANFAFLIRVRESGRLDISHDAIRRVIRRLLDAQSQSICGLLADYFMEIEDPTAEAIAAFFGAVRLGKIPRKVVEYIGKYRHVLSSLDAVHSAQRKQIQKSMAELYLSAGGDFMLASMQSCQSLDEIAYLQSALSSSLLGLNDYLSDETVAKIMQICMAIPIHISVFPIELAQMELVSCRKFLQRHQITEPEHMTYLEYCQEKLRERGKNAESAGKTDNSVEGLMAQVKDETCELTQRVLAWEKLCTLGREMAKSGKNPQEAEQLLESLLEILSDNPMELPEDLCQITLADIYTTLGQLGKKTAQWEKGIAWDLKSKAIYQQIYEKSPSADIFRKYRARVYNVANIVEAWAMKEKTNHDLWHRTKEYYAEVYRLEMQAIAQGIPERELMLSASAILSYGTAMINSGDPGGAEKFDEGIGIVQELTANNPRPDLYLELCLHLLECAYQLCGNDCYADACQLCPKITSGMAYVLSNGQPQHAKELWKYAVSFNNRINEMLAKLAQKQDLDNSLLLYRISDALHSALLPMDDPDIKANLMVVKRNVGNFLFHKGQLADALEAYTCLLSLVREHQLPQPNRNGKFDDRATFSLANVFTKVLLCLERLEQADQLKERVEQAPDWAGYICEHTESLQGDPARVLLAMGSDLSQAGSSLGLALLMQAFSATQREGYDQEKNKNTVLLVLQALAKLKDDKPEG